jgi:hypothetical protein
MMPFECGHEAAVLPFVAYQPAFQVSANKNA